MEFDKKYMLKLILVNTITIIRIIAAILLIFLYNKIEYYKLAIIILIFISTDFIDGLLARYFNVSTFFGSIMDAVSDKIFIITVLMLVIFKKSYVSILLILEILIFAINLVVTKKGNVEGSSYIGKIKIWILTLFFVVSFILLDNNIIKLDEILINRIIFILFMLCVIFEILTIFSYLRRYQKDLKVENLKLKSNDEIKKILFSHKSYIDNKSKNIKDIIYEKVK